MEKKIIFQTDVLKYHQQKIIFKWKQYLYEKEIFQILKMYIKVYKIRITNQVC